LKSGTTFRIDSMTYSDDPTDRSRAADYALVPDDSMKGAWRTPTLRDIAITAPYMHDGYYRSLDDVVWHYNNGGTRDGVAPSEIAKQIHPLYLSDSEVADLVAFLKSLTGDPLPADRTRAPVLP